jgi:hypothetical protein
MNKFDPAEQKTIRASELMYGLMSWFYNRGHHRTCPSDEGLYADQRVFGPAEAKGLLADDGQVWSITEAGVAWMEQFAGRSPWKETPSKRYSHWIKVQRVRHRLRVIHGGRTRNLRKAANG